MKKYDNIIEFNKSEATEADKNNRLYRLRSASKLTQQELSNMTGICLSSIQRVESGKKLMVNIKLRTAFLFAKALSCSVDDLIDDTQINRILDYVNNGMQDVVSDNYFKLFKIVNSPYLNVCQNKVVTLLLGGKNVKEIAKIMNCTTLYVVALLDYARAKIEKRKFIEKALLIKYTTIFKFADLSIFSPPEQDIIFLLLEDLTLREIAIFYKMNYLSVCRILRDASKKVMTNSPTNNDATFTDTFMAAYLTYFKNTDISSLPRIYKLIVVMFIEGNTIPDIATSTGYNIHNIMSLLCDAQNILTGKRTIVSIKVLEKYTDLFKHADLSVLTDHQMEVVSLLLESMTIEEIASFLGWKIYRTRSVIQRAKEKIISQESNR